MDYFTGEIIVFNNIKFKVLDVLKLNFKNANIGIKSAKTKVKRAKGGEKIETINENGKIEGVEIAKEGDAIFCNNDKDIYIPHESNSESWKFDEIEKHGYKIIEKQDEYIIIQSNNEALLLFDIITCPTCIKNAWGEGKHQYLYEGAVLKKDLKSGKVTGIDKNAFEKTWEVKEENYQSQV